MVTRPRLSGQRLIPNIKIKNMKKLMMAALALTLGCSAMAQTKADTTQKPENFVMRYHGKMMKIVDGKPSPMTETITLNNGAKVAVDGSVKLPNGKKLKIKENQKVTMSGKMSMATGN
jgi:Domain of unknown function (DUF6799)